MKSYEKSILKQLTEMLEENDTLKFELKKVKAENTELKSKVRYLENTIKRIETSIEERINQAVNAAVEKATSPLLEKNRKSKQRNIKTKGTNKQGFIKFIETAKQLRFKKDTQ